MPFMCLLRLMVVIVLFHSCNGPPLMRSSNPDKSAITNIDDVVVDQTFPSNGTFEYLYNTCFKPSLLRSSCFVVVWIFLIILSLSTCGCFVCWKKNADSSGGGYARVGDNSSTTIANVAFQEKSSKNDPE